MRREIDLLPPAAQVIPPSGRSALLWASIGVPVILLIATCTLIAGELRAGEAAGERALRAQAVMKDLGELRQAMQVATASQPADRVRTISEARRMLTVVQQSRADREAYPLEFARLQESATKTLDELEAPGGPAVHAEHSAAPEFGSAHHAVFAIIESLEAKERFVSELGDQMAEHYKNDLKVELAGAAFLVVVLQAWIWVVLRVEYRNRARVEQLLRDTNQLLEVSVQERTASLSAANRRLIDLQEQERHSLARELHDQLGQQMATLLLNLRRLQSKAGTKDSTDAAPILADSVDIAHATYEQVRNMALELRPALLDRMGLVAAVDWYGRQQQARSGCEISVSADQLCNRLAGQVATAAFRIVQEAVTNAIRHGAAPSISIFLQCHDGALDLGIHDDGKGFDVDEATAPAGAGFGLPGMRERARLLGGTFSVRSSPRSGTEINVHLPLPESQSREENDTAASG